MVYASNILYVVTIYASKYSVALFFLRIAGSHSRSRGAIGLTATCGVLSVVSFLTIAVENNASQLWLLGAPNKGTMVRCLGFLLYSSLTVPAGQMDSGRSSQ